MSGVKGFVGENAPPTVALVSSLQRLAGRVQIENEHFEPSRITAEATAVGKSGRF